MSLSSRIVNRIFAFNLGNMRHLSHSWPLHCLAVDNILLKNYANSSNLSNPSNEQVVEQLVSRLQSLGHTVFLSPDYAIQSAVPVLLEKGFKVDEIVQLMTEHKEHWLSLKGKTVSMLLRVFNAFQVEAQEVILLLANEPKILQLQEEYLIQRLSALRHIFAVELDSKRSKGNEVKSNLSKLLYKCPSVLFDDTERYLETKSFLKNFFSNKDIGHLLKHFPWILTLDAYQLELSYEYLHFVMGLEPSQMRTCRWFDYGLDKLHLRFKFAQKSGNYVKPHPKKPAISKHNLELSKFVETTDVHFANLCRCAPEDFNAFVALYEPEFEDIDNIKNEIQQNARFKAQVYNRHEKRVESEKDEDEVKSEGNEVEEELDEFSPMNDQPVLVNKQWDEARRRGKRRKR